MVFIVPHYNLTYDSWCVLLFQQEGYLCAQHCLNALLQGPYFTPVELATLGQQMDDEERIRMAENGVDSADYQRFLEVIMLLSFCRCEHCSERGIVDCSVPM